MASSSIVADLFVDKVALVLRQRCVQCPNPSKSRGGLDVTSMTKRNGSTVARFGGETYGESDEWSYKAAKNPTYCYDLHATVLHLLGIDHEKLTFRHNGIDRRLTDVHGKVIEEVLS